MRYVVFKYQLFKKSKAFIYFLAVRLERDVIGLYKEDIGLTCVLTTYRKHISTVKVVAILSDYAFKVRTDTNAVFRNRF